MSIANRRHLQNLALFSILLRDIFYMQHFDASNYVQQWATIGVFETFQPISFHSTIRTALNLLSMTIV